MGKFTKIVFFAGVLLVVPNFASATVIFQDNFDTCTSNCTAAQLAAPSGWAQWYGPNSATVGGVTHNPGEITAPGRGGGGKSFKTWRAGPNWEGYNGTFAYYFPGSHTDIYMRYYVKLPSALELTCSGGSYMKLWRYNTNGGPGEIYLNMNHDGSLRNSGRLQLYTAGHGHTTILDNANLRALMDDTWHSWEWHVNLSTGVVEFWVDGVRRYNASNWNFGGGSFSLMQHFSMGNVGAGCTWQPTWQAQDIDDFVLSTTYVGPSGGTTPPPATDTTPPVISNPQPSATLGAGTVSTTMRVTTNENATCKYGTSNVAYSSLPSTFSTTGATSHSTSLTGLTNGSSATYYVRCIDSSGNASTASTPITVAVSTTQPSTPPSTSNIFFQDNFDNNCSGTACNSSGNAPSGYIQWYKSGGTTATADSVTHYSGEFSPGGRGGTGKSLKLWRHSGVFGDYTGSLAYDFSKSTNNLFMRYYLKMPTAFDGTDGEFKSWRMNLVGGGEIYLHFKGCGNSCRSNGSWTIYDGASTVTALNNADLRAIWDGNWHSVEWELGLGTRTLKLWIDGVLKYNNTNKTWSSSQPFDFMQHFPIGNTYSHNGTWQSTWQALEVDDLALSTSYIGPIGGGGGGTTPPPSGEDTTPPVVPTGVTVS